MAITRWDPFAEIVTMERNLDRLFSRIVPTVPLPDLESSVWMPTTDILTSGEDMIVRAELPGIEPKDVEISVTDGVLHIHGERSTSESKSEEGYVMRESFRGSFERRLTLPEGVDPESITAHVENGVLEVTVPHAAAMPASVTRHVPITSAGEATPVLGTPKPAEEPTGGGSETA